MVVQATSDPSEEFVTDLPAVESVDLDTDTVGEIGIEVDVDINNGETVIETRRVGDEFEELATIPFDSTAEATLEDTDDGVEYEVRARTQTDDVTTDFVTTAAISGVPPPTVEITDIDQESIQISIDDPANATEEILVKRSDEIDAARSSGYTDFETVDVLDAVTTSTTLVGLDANTGYQIRVDAVAPNVTVESNIVADRTELDLPGEGFAMVLERPADPVDERIQIDSSIEKYPALEPEQSAIGRWSVDIPESPTLREWARSECYIYLNRELVFRGPLTRYETRQSSANATLVGLDILDKLDSGGDRLSIEEPEFGFVILDEFLSGLEEPSFEVDVIEPSDTLIDDDTTVQNAETTAELTDVFDPEGDSPFVITDDNITLSDSLVLAGAEGGSGGSTEEDEEIYSGGFARTVGEGESFTVSSVEIEHDYEDGVLAYRAQSDDGEMPGVEITLGGDSVETFVSDSIGELQWRTIPVGELDAGTFDIDVEAGPGGDLDGGAGRFIVDAFALFDDRFSFDDNLSEEIVDEQFEPTIPTKAESATIEAEGATTEFNIVRGRVDIDIDDVSGSQAIDLSFDGGETFAPSDGDEKNTSSVEAEASEPTTTVIGRLTLGRTEPTTAPSVSAWRVGVDTNALRVIQDQEYAGSPFDIATTIADDSGMIIVPVYDEDELKVRVMEPGAIVRDVDWRAVDYDFADDTEEYYNAITVFGGDDPDGDPIEVTIESQSEIDRIGDRVEGPAVDRPDARSEAEASAIARVELAKGIAADRETGWVEIESQIVQPGYAFVVDEFPGNPTLTLQSATFEWGTQRLDFEGDDFLDVLGDFAADIGVAKRASR